MPNLSEFIAHVNNKGLARPNRFMVDITFPQRGRGNSAVDYFSQYGITPSDSFRASLFCETASLPGKTITTTDEKIYGPPVRMPYDIAYDTYDMTFYVASDMKEKFFFDAWQNMIVDPDTGDVNYYKEFVSKITIYQLDVNEQQTYCVELYDAYPVAVTEMRLAQDDTDNVHRLPVTFSYKKWKPKPLQMTKEVVAIKELLLNAGPISNKLQSELYNLKRRAINKFDKNNIFAQDTIFDLF